MNSSVRLLLMILALMCAMAAGHQFRKGELVRRAQELEFKAQEMESRAKRAEQELWQCRHQANYRTK